MDSRDKGTLYSLQIGRAVAALMVVVCHATVATNIVFPDLPDWIFNVFDIFDLGVDYFFVLSGFIIAHTTWDRPKDRAHAKHYALTRATRIFMPYLPIALGLIGIITLVPSMADNPYSLFASLTLLPSNDLPVLSVAWSLQHEIVFYVLFGMCFFVFKNPKLIFLWAIPMLILPFVEFPRWGNVAAGFFNLEFLFGVAICHFYHAGRFKHMRYQLVLLGIALLLLGGVLMFNGYIPHYYRVISGAGFAAIVLGLVYLEGEIDFRKFRALVFLGGASYSLYLVHSPIIFASLKMLPALPHWSVAFAFFIALGIVAGIAYYLIIEKPLMRITRARLGAT